MIVTRQDPRAALFEHLLRTRFGVTDPGAEDPALMRRAVATLEQDIKALDPVGMAYAGLDMRRDAPKHEYEYDPSAGLWRMG